MLGGGGLLSLSVRFNKKENILDCDQSNYSLLLAHYSLPLSYKAALGFMKVDWINHSSDSKFSKVACSRLWELVQPEVIH